MLTRLELSDCKVAKISPSISKLTRLRDLNLKGNYLYPEVRRFPLTIFLYHQAKPRHCFFCVSLAFSNRPRPTSLLVDLPITACIAGMSRNELPRRRGFTSMLFVSHLLSG